MRKSGGRELAAGERGGQSEQKKKAEEKNPKAGSTLVLARRAPWRAVCSGWSYPIQAESPLVLGGVPVLPASGGPLLWLKRVGSVAGLAVHSSA